MVVSIRKLIDEANAVIPDAFIDRAHRVSKINDTVIGRFTTVTHHTMFYRNRKAWKGKVAFHLDLTKSRFGLLMKANKFAKDVFNVDFAYFGINCHLKVRFKIRIEEFFGLLEDLITKIDCLER